MFDAERPRNAVDFTQQFPPFWQRNKRIPYSFYLLEKFQKKSRLEISGGMPFKGCINVEIHSFQHVPISRLEQIGSKLSMSINKQLKKIFADNRTPCA